MAANGEDPIRKLSKNKGTVSLSFPKEEMRDDGVFSDDGPGHAKVERIGPGEFKVELLDL